VVQKCFFLQCTWALPPCRGAAPCGETRPAFTAGPLPGGRRRLPDSDARQVGGVLSWVSQRPRSGCYWSQPTLCSGWSSSHPSGMRWFGRFLFRGCRSAKAASLYPRLMSCHPSGMASASRRDAGILAGGRGRVLCDRHPRKPSPQKFTRTPAGARGKPRGIERAATGWQALAGSRPTFIGTH